MEKRENPLKDKSYKFALRIIKLYKHLTEERREFVMSKFCGQELRSGLILPKEIRHNPSRILYIHFPYRIKDSSKLNIGFAFCVIVNILPVNKQNLC
jgi:hypothetical protein